jgi:hypothetical protein
MSQPDATSPQIVNDNEAGKTGKQAKIAESSSTRMPTVASMASAVALTGMPLDVMRRMKSAGCDAFSSSGRVNIGKLIRAFFAEFTEGAADEMPDGVATWREALNRAQTKREELRLQKERGNLMDIESAKLQAAQAMEITFAEMDRLCREMPPALKGLDEVSIFQKLESRREEMRNALKESFAKVGEPEKANT